MEPLLVCHHLPKTAGTSLRRVLKANFRPGELVNLTGRQKGDPADWWQTYWSSLSSERRAAIRCVTAHSAQFLLPAVTERPVRAFCLLRDPVERVVSSFFYIAWMDEHGQRSPMIEAMRRRGWELSDVYREVERHPTLGDELADRFWPLFNGQARELLAPVTGFTSLALRPEAAQLERHRGRVLQLLSERYVVGVTERFSQSVRLFADSFGWSKAFVPRENVRPYGPRRDLIDEETRSLIGAHNTLDTQLHSQYRAKLETLPPTSRGDDLRWRGEQRARRGLRWVRRGAQRSLRRTTSDDSAR